MKQELIKCKVKDKPEIDWYFHQWVVLGQYNEACAILENCKKGIIKIFYAEDIEFCQAITLQTESESKAIPELSDDEIENLLINWRKETGKTRYTSVEGFRAGARLYREQLKQKQ